jgi:D-xylose transport system substrate-binding protein
VFKATKPETDVAVQMALALANGEELAADLVPTTVNNGAADVPSNLLTPIAVTKDNVTTAESGGQKVLGPPPNGYQDPAAVCTAQYKADCEALGISS